MNKRIIAILLTLMMMIGTTACGDSDSYEQKSDGQRKETESEQDELQEAEEIITSNIEAAYYHDFVNLIPFGEDVPYVSVEGEALYPNLSYDWFKTMSSGDFPCRSLSSAYVYAFSDIIALNGYREKDIQMGKYIDCLSLEDKELMGACEELLWYMTFLNYQCDIETEEDEYGTLVHVKISNTDMVKLMYEEMEKTYNMVKEDNKQAAAERLNGAFEQVRTFLENEAENDELDHIDIVKPKYGAYKVVPIYGSSLITKLNLIDLGAGLFYEQAKYFLNKSYWEKLSNDGTLYNYSLSQMLIRLYEGDYDIVNTELTFYAEVDDQDNGYLPFDKRIDRFSFVPADRGWDSLVDVLRSKGIANVNCSMDNLQSGNYNHRIRTWGKDAEKDYSNMLFWVIMGWRGSIVQGQPVAEYPDSIGYLWRAEVNSMSSNPSAVQDTDDRAGRTVVQDNFVIAPWPSIPEDAFGAGFYDEYVATEKFVSGEPFVSAEASGRRKTFDVRKVLGSEVSRPNSTFDVRHDNTQTIRRKQVSDSSDESVSPEELYCIMETEQDSHGNITLVHQYNAYAVYDDVFSYDSANRLIRFDIYEYPQGVSREASGVVYHYEYRYDSAGRLISDQLIYDQKSTSLGGYTRSYTYDDKGRLIQAADDSRYFILEEDTDDMIIYNSLIINYEYDDEGKVGSVIMNAFNLWDVYEPISIRYVSAE